jgi:uncharacterized membrane protein YraQ (UPF0718 family)
VLPYLAAGVLVEATIRTFKWHVRVRNVLAGMGVLAIPAATLLGVASPLCACATLPLVISLVRAGLPLAPAMSLLVASPLMSPGAYAMIAAMLGAGWANVVLVCAVSLGLAAGLVTHALRRRGFGEGDRLLRDLPAGDFHDPDYPVEGLRCECGKMLSNRLERHEHGRLVVFLAKAWEGLWKIGRLVLLGIVVEVLVATFVPNEWITGLLTGEGPWPILVLTVATIPIHLPQVTATSLLFGHFLPDPGEAVPLARGAGIAVLVGGPVTALPVMAALLTMFRRRVFGLYLGICVGGTLALAFGYELLPV